MEPVFFYFEETPIGVDNRFTLDFSNTELIYLIKFSTENDYHITTMNCNLVIARILESLTGCHTMFLFAVFYKISALERNAY